jgi:hypothetical protein
VMLNCLSFIVSTTVNMNVQSKILLHPQPLPVNRKTIESKYEHVFFPACHNLQSLQYMPERNIVNDMKESCPQQCVIFL